MRKSTFLWLGLAAISAAALFHTSQQVTDGREKLAVIEHDIQKEEETLRVLQAEWSYLNQPDRLEKLVQQYLQLEPMKGRQFAKMDKLEAAPPLEKMEAPADKAAPQKIATITDPEAPPADEPAAVTTAPAPAAPEAKAVETAISTAKGSADEAVVAGEATPPKPGKKLQKQATESATSKTTKPAEKKTAAAAKPAPKTEKKPQQADSRNFDDMMKGLTKP